MIYKKLNIRGSLLDKNQLINLETKYGWVY